MHAFTRRLTLVAGTLAAITSAANAQSADFNGDGFADLAIGVPAEGIGALLGAGGVNVIYGAAGGLGPALAQFWSQASVGMPDPAEIGDDFGRCLATGDFNGDSFDDLAIGVPLEDVGVVVDAGAVVVIYGGPAGLGTGFAPIQFWHQNSAGVPDVCEPGDRFGCSLASADFNLDGADDLAIGVPFEDNAAGVADGGVVHVIYGSTAFGLQTAVPASALFAQGAAGVPDAFEAGDHFGWSLAAGQFNRFEGADLAIGVPDEDVIPGAADHGCVIVIHGLAGGGLAAAVVPGAQLWHQDIAGIPDLCEAGDRFGYALAGGDFDTNGSVDLAIGVPNEEVLGVGRAGAVNTIYSIPGGGLMVAAPVPPQFWHQNSPGVPEVIGIGDLFGSSLASGDLDASGSDDLVIGVPFEDVGGSPVVDGGAANVIYSMPGLGLSSIAPTVPEIWHQNIALISQVAGTGDQFALSVAVGDFNGDGIMDAAFGVPMDDIGGGPVVDAGGVNVIYGMPIAIGLDAAGNQFWTQNSAGIPDVAEPADGMGAAVRSR